MANASKSKYSILGALTSTEEQLLAVLGMMMAVVITRLITRR